MTNKTLTTTQARTQLFSLVDQVGDCGMSFTITKDGLPKAIMLSPDEYDAWQETLDILSNKDLMKDLREAERQVAAGEVLSIDELKKNLGIS